MDSQQPVNPNTWREHPANPGPSRMDAARPASKFECVLGYPGPLPCRGCPRSCPEHPEAARPAGGQYDEWDVYSLQARVADLEAQDAAVREHLREFNHVEGEPTSEIAAVAESTFGFLRHRVEAAEARVAALTAELETLRNG